MSYQSIQRRSTNGSTHPTLVISTVRFRDILTQYHGHLLRLAGTYIWGRGSSDDKSGLISSLWDLPIYKRSLPDHRHRASVETLLEKKFVPTRTIVLAFGFDEETSGLFVCLFLSKRLTRSDCREQGAQKIGEYLLRQYGENAFALLVDEGGLYLVSSSCVVSRFSCSCRRLERNIRSGGRCASSGRKGK